MLELIINQKLIENFAADIENIIETNNNISYIEAIVYYSEKNNIEIETIAEIISKNPNLKSKLMEDGMKLNLLKKVARLPI